MPVIDNSALPTFRLPGITHQTVAGQAQGVKSMEVWLQTLAAGAETPVHRHACEEVIVVLRGSGRVTVEGHSTEFGPNTTLVVPPDAIHQLVNTGHDEMFLLAALAMAPVRVRTADGTPLPVPWEAPQSAS